MRHARYVYTAAALTAVAGLDQQAVGETVDIGVGSLTVAATWRAQPSTIAQGGATTFKLSLKASGSDDTSGISFGQSLFTFSSGSGTSAPTSAELLLNPTAASAGSTMTAMVQPIEVTYFEEGLHTATIAGSNAPISWSELGVSKNGTYSLNMGTTVTVGGARPTLQSASVPVLIQAGQSFAFSALADAGATGGLSYFWDFDNDGTFDSTVQNPNFAYATTGVHTGLLRIMGGDGSTDFQYAVDVMDATITAVPLPAAVWGGLGLITAVGAIRSRAARKHGDQQV